MNDPFNRFTGSTFARTQPREWRDIPFSGSVSRWPLVLKIIGILLAWVALFGLSMWSIGQQMPEPQYHGQIKKAAQ